MTPELRPELELVATSPRTRVRMLEQMAGTLEAEIAGLCRRAAAFEEDDNLIQHEIESQQEVLNRLSARRSELRAERDGLLSRIESLTTEALEMREQVSNYQDEIVLEALKDTRTQAIVSAGSRARRANQNSRRRWRDRD